MERFDPKNAPWEDAEAGTRLVVTPEPLWFLRSCEASAYFKSHHWRLRREAFLEATERRCALCGCTSIGQQNQEQFIRWSLPDHTPKPLSPRSTSADFESVRPADPVPREPDWKIHHISYRHRGAEPDEDLRLLCSPCHQLVHRPESDAAKEWVIHLNDPELSTRAAALRPGDFPWYNAAADEFLADDAS